MANVPLGDVPSIQEDDLFNDESNIRLNVSNEFRQLAMTLVRNALSKSMLQAEARDPADSELVTGLTQYWINTDTGSRFISVAGADWVDVTPVGTNTEGNDGDDGWSPLFSIESDNDRRVLKLVDWMGGGGTKPDVNQYLTATGYDTDIANAVDIRGLPGLRGIQGIQGIQGIAGLNAWTPVFEIVADEARRVMRIRAWTGGGGDPPASGQYIGDSGPVDAIADAVDLRGPAGDAVDGALTAVATDDTLQGDGTAQSPLGVADNTDTGEIGRIFLVGSYTFGTSATPVSENAGYAGGNLYVHTTASDGNKATILESLSQGDYLYIGRTILEITAAPTSASSVYTFAVNVLQGEVPTSESHTLYYITERRALIAGAVHLFHLAFGDPNGFLGYNASGAAVVKENPLANFHLSKPTLIGRWEKRNTNGGTSGTFQPILPSSSNPQLYFNSTDDDGTDRAAALTALGKGDSIFIEGFNVLRLTRSPVNSSGSIACYGEWADDYTTRDGPGNGDTVNIYHIGKGASVGTTPIPGNLLSFAADFALTSVSSTGGQRDDSGSTAEVDINSGIYSVLGDWERGSASLPDTGKYYTEATTVVLNPTDANRVARGDVIQTLGVGDRIQFGAINAFVLSAVPINVNGWSMSGAWVNTWVAGDFDGETTLYVIKKNNVVVRNNAVPGRFLKLNADLEVIANNPADSIETIWEGEFTSATTGRQSLNAGKKFSDYTDVIFNYSGINRRNLWTVPVALWDALNATEFGNRDARLALTHRSDTEFELAAGDSGIRLYKIYGYKGV